MSESQRSEDGRPLALVEHPDGASRWAYARALERAGYDVVTCGGPRELPGGRCPLVTAGCCERAEQADVVVSGLGMEAADVLLALQVRLPGTPLVAVETPVTQDAEVHAVVPHAVLLRRPTERSLIDTCRAVQRGR